MGNPLAVSRVLPHRRQSLRAKHSYVVDGAEFKLYVTVGIDPADGKVGEIFVRSGGGSGKNSMLHRLLDAGAVLISHCLQRGMTLDEVAASLGTETPLAEAVRIAGEMQRDVSAWPPGAALLGWQPPRL